METGRADVLWKPPRDRCTLHEYDAVLFKSEPAKVLFSARFFFLCLHIEYKHTKYPNSNSIIAAAKQTYCRYINVITFYDILVHFTAVAF